MKDTRIRIGNHLKDLLEFHGFDKRKVDTITLKAGTQLEEELYEIVANWLYRVYEYKPCLYDKNNNELVFFKNDTELQEQWRKRNNELKKFE